MLERLVAAVDGLRVHDLAHLIGFYNRGIPLDRQDEALQGLAITGLGQINFGAGAASVGQVGDINGASLASLR
jgi:hypothetical protein